MKEQVYYKVVRRTDDGDLVSIAATCYGLGVVYKEEGRTPAPHYGPLLVFDSLPNAAKFARGRLAGVIWNWEIWECRAGNPRPAPRVLKMWTLGRDGMGKVPAATSNNANPSRDRRLRLGRTDKEGVMIFYKVVSRQPDNRLISPHPRLATSLAVEYVVGRKTQADIGPIFIYDSLGRPRRDAKRLALVRPGIEIWRCVAGGVRKIPRVPPCHAMAKDPALAAAWWRGKAPHVVTRPSFDGAWVADWVILYGRVDN